MRRLLLPATLLLLIAPLAEAQQANRAAPQSPRPSRLGDYQSWTAAAHTESGQKVCYAFTRARSLDGVGGRDANNVMLLVTHRPGGRDQVAVRSGYNFPRGAETKLFVGQNEFAFFTASDNSFARDGRAVVAALRGGREAVHRGPGPNGRGQATDTFALAGFTQAYEAIGRECPPPARR
ncbi:invasion associated locus B family protein [Sediminicoccus sp. BL-A-41-H5]|uniref:invasion associated locus B family protein n=1 Tax=Sediminicoccus sp. BL-A-41-H5 TaxID=3421106 RepID=UPI003D665195